MKKKLFFISSSLPDETGLQAVTAQTHGTIVSLVLRRLLSLQSHQVWDNDLFGAGSSS